MFRINSIRNSSLYFLRSNYYTNNYFILNPIKRYFTSAISLNTNSIDNIKISKSKIKSKSKSKKKNKINNKIDTITDDKEQKNTKTEKQLIKDKEEYGPNSFERTIENEIYQSKILSNELEKAEDILVDAVKNKHLSIQSQTMNLLLRAWINRRSINKAVDCWAVFNKLGIPHSPRSYSIMLSGLARQGRTGLLPQFTEYFYKDNIKPEKLLNEYYYRKENFYKQRKKAGKNEMDPFFAIKLPSNCPLPNGTFYNPNNPHTKEDKTPYQKQIESEISRVDENVRSYKRSFKQLTEIGKSAELSPGRKLMIHCFADLNNVISDYITNLQKTENIQNIGIHNELICSLSSEKLAVITLHEVLSNVMIDSSRGAVYTTTCMCTGQAVQAEIKFEEQKRQLKSRQKTYIQKRASNSYKRIVALNRALSEKQQSLEETEKEDVWTPQVTVKVGSTLVALLIDNIYIKNFENTSTINTNNTTEVVYDSSNEDLELKNQFDPTMTNNITDLREHAFSHNYVFNGKKRRGVIIPHEEIITKLDPQEYCDSIINPFNAKLLPMYITPRPWKNATGPYYYAKAKIMRTYSKNQENTLRTSNLETVEQLLTALGEIPWKINTRVYSVVNEGWKRGGNLPYVPNRSAIKAPDPPEDIKENAESRLLWRREKAKTNQKNKECFSLRCDFLLKLNTATTLLKEDRFFFPHNMDFRGRCYPIPPHLNHMGSDLCRGLLHFAEGKELGKRGLYWLKVHIASLCGVNKVSFDDRVKFTEKHINDIIDSAENPLDGNRWWLDADDAWQCLSCCFELRDALKLKDPTKYISHIPIHMDGSCNGLQHYAALGGDIDGARSVNLIPASEPQDVYTHVLNIVKKQIEEDRINGIDIAEKLAGKIIRKTIKQTVMTSVYGVTYIGARKQIAGQLRDQQAISDTELFEASVYVTKITFAAMQSMFTQARQIMGWLGDTARAVSRTGTTMSWITPLGIPVEQHYRRPGKLQVKTLLQNVILAEHSDDLPVLVQKQRSAFPPNYVHSLDSTHMFKTAKLCYDSGLTFAAVHDSFWTHANSVDDLSKYLRNAFVELHSRPLLEELRLQIAESHPNLVLPQYPERGPLDIKQVLKSPYFFH